MEIETKSVLIYNPLDMALRLEYDLQNVLMAAPSANGFTYAKPETLPKIGLLMIDTFTDEVIRLNSDWANYSKENRSRVINYDILFNNYLSPEYIHKTEIYDHVQMLLFDYKELLIKFISNEYWVMHCYTKKNGLDIYIEKTIDYRIFKWMQEHGL